VALRGLETIRVFTGFVTQKQALLQGLPGPERSYVLRTPLSTANVRGLESYDKTRFRITQFPSERIPLPRPIFTEDRHLVDDDSLLLTDREAWTYSTAEYGELYLELARLDLTSDQAIKDFVVQHHALSVYQDRPEWRGIEGDTWFYPGFAWRYGFSLVAHYLTDRRQELGWQGMGIETLEEFRWGAWVLKDMIAAWRIFRGEVRHENAVWEAPCWLDARNQFDAVVDFDAKELRETVQPRRP
jgi:hypothetical protein